MQVKTPAKALFLQDLKWKKMERQQGWNSTIETIHIYNVLGEDVQSSDIGHRTSVALDVSGLYKGIYFIEVKTEKGLRRKKFIKN